MVRGAGGQPQPARRGAGGGHWARALGATAPLVLARREHRESFAAFDALVPHARTVLVAPMRVSDQAVGLFLCFAGGTTGSAEDRELLSTVASQAALAVQNARLIEALTERNVVRDLFEALMLGDQGELGLEARAHRLGVDLSRPSVIVTFEIAAHPPDVDGDRVWAGLRQDLTGAFPERSDVPRPRADGPDPAVGGDRAGCARRAAGRGGRAARASARPVDLRRGVPGVPAGGRLP